MIRAVTGTVLLTTVTLLPAGLCGQAGGSYTLSGDRVAIYNLAGMVEIRAGSGSAVGVDVRPGGRDAGELTVATGRIGSYETLRVMFPDDRIIYPEMGRRSRTQMRVRDDGTFGDGRGGYRIEITGSGRGVEAFADLVISVPAGRDVSVYVGVGEVFASNVNGTLMIDVASSSVTARGIRGALSIDTGSGSVDVSSAEGEVSIDTGSGSVELADIRGPRLLVDTGSGGVRGRGITARDLRVDTGSGGITLEDVTTTNANLDTGSGGVRLDLLSDVDDLVIDTGSGGVTVGFPDELGATLDLESSSGGIDFDVPIQVRRFDRSSLRGSIGDGRGTIRIDTGSGSIRFIKR